MKSLLRLVPYLRPFLGLIAMSAVLAIPLSALRLAPAPLVKHVVDDLLVNKSAGRLLIFPIVVIGIYVLNFGVRFAHYYLLRVVIARVNQRLKNELYEHLLGLSADYYTAQSTGALISRVGSDPNLVDGGIATINMLVREPITFLFLFGYALHLNWRLTVITLIVLPLMAWVFAVSGRNIKRYIHAMQEENGRLFSTLQETFTGIRVIKMFGLEDFVKTKFRDRSENFTRVHLKTAVLEELSHPMIELITSFMIAAVIYYGGRQVIDGRMTSGDLLAFFTTFALLLNPLRMLNDINIRLNQAAAACGRLFEVFDWKSRIAEAREPIRMSALEKGIRVEGVHFAYPDAPEREILRGVSFSVHRGQAVALVGASGAGKSSFISLLPRIFDVTRGRILIDGRDVREIATADLRALIAVVSQDVFLFNDTIRENIRCGKLNATDEEIREAAKRAHALEFIERIPGGFGAIIGDRGQKLSGGERQRLSIARAFLRESPILLLDEATSSLDSTSERAVQTALEELMRNRTTIVVAHRLSTIQDADRILVLREGILVEEGTHQELLALNGEYKRFLMSPEARA